MLKLHFNPCPKVGKKPKAAPKPLKRTPIKPGRSKFKADYGDGKRSRQLSNAEVWRRARKCQAELIAKATPEELEIAAFLRELQIKFEFQKIWQNGDLWIITDFYIPSRKLVLEVDGFQHRDNKPYDHKRGTWLSHVYRVHIARLWNSEVTNGSAKPRIRAMLGLAIPQTI